MPIKIIASTDIVWLENDIEHFNSRHSPIPITVEMLVEELFCIDGFKIVKEKSCAEKYLLPYQHLSVMFKNSGIIVFCWNDIELKRINYLHELQNLHYGFTREMLTLKSKA